MYKSNMTLVKIREFMIDGSKMYINNVGLADFEANSSDLLSIVRRSLLNQTISSSIFFIVGHNN